MDRRSQEEEEERSTAQQHFLGQLVPLLPLSGNPLRREGYSCPLTQSSNIGKYKTYDCKQYALVSARPRTVSESLFRIPGKWYVLGPHHQGGVDWCPLPAGIAQKIVTF